MAKKNLEKRVELNGSIHHLPHGSKVRGRTNPTRLIRLTLAVRTKAELPDHSALDHVKAANRKYLTRERLAEEFGSHPEVVDRITGFAKAHNLVITRNDVTSGHMGLAGTVADISAAFGVALFDYTHPILGEFHARTGPVHLPSSLAKDILGVFGLNNHRILQRHPRKPDSQTESARGTGRRQWFFPNELVPIYDFPDANTSGQCIGLLEFGGGVNMHAVTNYFNQSLSGIIFFSGIVF